ncbi:MAG: lysostaphin resistance A-like protein [Planctomycetota bacterium]
MSEVAWTQVAASWPQIAVIAGSLTAFLWVAAGSMRRLGRGEPLLAWRPHPPVPWEGADVAIVAAGYLCLAATLQHLASTPRTPVNRLVDNVFLSVGATLLALAWLRFRGADRVALGLEPARLGESLAVAVRALALCVFPLLALAMILNAVVPYEHPVVDFLADQRGPTAALLVILSAVVVAPVAEELFFRRVLQGWLEKQFEGDRGVAVAVAAIAFAAAHAGQGLAFIPLFLLGCLLGTIAERTGSIVPCILLHGLFNAVSVFVMLARPPAA